MKKITFLLALLTAATSFAQNGKLGIQFNAGAHLMSESGNGFSFNSALTYNFVPSFGLKLDGGLDMVGEDNLNRLGLQVNFNVIKLANQTAKFGLELHGGGALINNGNSDFTDSYLLRGDDMIAIMAGITPSFQVNDKLRILVDATYMPKIYKINGVITKYLNTTVGVAYQF
ncbi:MAG: hypothetical protein RIR94_431 [Bacteroidota bacterium]|jgi:hypothetical protein